jgi:ABC-2 type transport system ATP-binding protein
VTRRESGPILTAASVRHAYSGRPVLRGVDLQVSGGEIVALLGPNGAGKTTLVRAVCGRFEPDAGEVRVAGRNPYRDPKARSVLGLVPQALALYPHLTVAENLAAFGRLAGLKGAGLRQAVAEAMALTRTTDRAATLIKRLSGGLQRRANIAAAILAGPQLLVLDEPTVGVDPPAREAVAEVLRRLRAEGVAILMITHDLDEAAVLADGVVFLREGVKVREGAPAQLIAEAFGDQMEVQVDVAPDLAPAKEARLVAEGLERGSHPGAWTRLAPDGYGLAAGLDQRLKAAGVEVREIHVRRPSLQMLFALLAEERRAA